jgi:hypothetical protein
MPSSSPSTRGCASDATVPRTVRIEGLLEAGLDTIASLARIASGQKPRVSPSAHETVATHRDALTFRRPPVSPSSSARLSGRGHCLQDGGCGIVER